LTGSGAGSDCSASLSGLGSKGRELDGGLAHAGREEVKAQVPGLVAILEGDANAGPEAFLRFAFAALP
jgi:hypothetical protein